MRDEEELEAARDLEAPRGRVPLIDCCPGCGSPLDGQKCKQICLNQGCMLYRRIIENCAGD